MCQSRNRYRKNLVPEKVPVSVSKIFGTGKSIGIGIVQHFGYRHTLLLSCVGHGHDTGADLNRVVELDENYTRGHMSAWS